MIWARAKTILTTLTEDAVASSLLCIAEDKEVDQEAVLATDAYIRVPQRRLSVTGNS